MIKQTYLGNKIKIVGTSDETLEAYYQTSTTALSPGEVYQVFLWCKEQNELSRRLEQERIDLEDENLPF